MTGKYRYDARLGGGGMAEVFVGQALGAEGFTRQVAIKRVLPGFSENRQFAQMFVAEAQLSSQLVHPNIVSVLDFDREADGSLFLVMELVAGRDLDALGATGMLPFPVIIFAIAEVLRGLGHAHDLPIGGSIRGVIHRDVSPHNVLLSWEGAVKVSDFGIAKARAASEATASQFIKGKPAYMSPEQASGRALDGRSDLFAVGVMMWELLVGRRLFVGKDTRTTLEAVLFAEIPRPRQLRPEVPKSLDKVVMKLLDRDLRRRYASAEVATRDLEACAEAGANGRDALIAILAERFPDAAPLRKNRSSADGSPIHLMPTLPAGGTPPHSLGAGRAAPTMLAAPRRRIAPRVAIVTALAIAVGAGAYAIVGGTRATIGSRDAMIGPGFDAAPVEKDATISPAMHSGSQAPVRMTETGSR